MLQELHLQYNDIGGRGGALLGTVLASTRSQVMMLDLERNPVGDIGATAIGAALVVNTALRSLKLACCNITDAGVVNGLAAGLAANKHVRSAWLDGNEIGSIGATALAEALVTNAGLIALNLRGNQFGDTGAAAFGKALAVNKKLVEIDLSTNGFTNEGAVALAIVQTSFMCLHWVCSWG
jgi:Ran GTPase-activating protein (RanGAP) involved in mRNA processing and transport